MDHCHLQTNYFINRRMKLHEITLTSPISDHGISLDSFDEESKTKIGNISDFEINLYQAKTNSNALLIAAEKDNKKISMITIQDNVNIHQQNFIMLRRTWTTPEHRGKGIVPQLILLIKKHLKKKILSDQKQTPNGKNVWDSLRKRYNVTALDVNTGDRIPANTVPDEEIYKKKSDDPENKFLLVLEGEKGPLQTFCDENIEPISYKILTPLPRK